MYIKNLCIIDIGFYNEILWCIQLNHIYILYHAYIQVFLRHNIS